MKIVMALAVASLSAGSVFAASHHQVDPLKGTHDSLANENKMANRENLTRIKDSLELEDFKKRGLLVPLRNTKTMVVDVDKVREEYRWIRPQTETFLLNFSADYWKRFGKHFRLNSAVRTITYQVVLRHKNRNAAPAYGPLASSHPTAATVDIAKKGMGTKELKWMRMQLAQFERLGRVQATEEFSQEVFHVMVSQTYRSKVTYATNEAHARKRLRS